MAKKKNTRTVKPANAPRKPRAETLEEFTARYRAARETLGIDRRDALVHLDQIDTAVHSVLVDLANYEELKDTAFELLQVVSASFCIRNLLEDDDLASEEEAPIPFTPVAVSQ